jgi:hypothetical protein
MDFSYFLASKICVSPTGVVFSLFSPRCRLSSGQRCHTAVPCHASFPWIQDELSASTSSSDNASFHHSPSRAETEAINLHHPLQEKQFIITPPIYFWYGLIIVADTKNKLFFVSADLISRYRSTYFLCRLIKSANTENEFLFLVSADVTD